MAQARVLLAALAERDPSALEAALHELPRREQQRVLARVKVDLSAFGDHAHAHAWLAGLA